ncbi:GIY-YIG nuclease family protein [Curtobacterium sp. MCBD17_040]|uniref:GIY-YIG nuclease family protein n=1 Tax=Curtobacterium sp. MCBD17_040 TaxID=2175674 RepID=UPI0015E8B506|nr:GIY-YIG nuclease family protein [Curtobacterium sp. MCBD17_040]WIB65861.1 GIY-YIG nuclease family protein [Curtobacterium sp. MCBD17_040]
MNDVDASESLSPRQEVEQLLAGDKGRLGDVFRRPGMEPDEVAADLNVASSAFVYNARRMIDALLDGRPVSGPTFRRQVLSVFRSQITRGRGVLSPSAMDLLLKNRAAIEAAGADEDPVEAASEAAEEQQQAATTLAELDGVPGIYAFSYGWYLESPVDPERGNTLIKVGQSINIGGRIRTHASNARTHIPEPLALIRAYSTGDRSPEQVERIFQDLLHAAGHHNPRRVSKSTGEEWFLTNEAYLDVIARTVGLRTIYTGRSEFATD